ncbi:type II secretion system secretin GspD [Endozoicomonas sp. SCSIO W0465]|uniref:type II secretion system secretin GspD n=1 Tax=Endozoicomonas sp. SCSIO W0465 TaxID=2918516 RepID=UPI0020755448|nr:type II secretion system secretin GspD [Endozoicomonas sp. SCSIO W0465]USE38816.1 type II secretion system secretin GspD [Endozoicomonas sp. SCSIO W0465]
MRAIPLLLVLTVTPLLANSANRGLQPAANSTAPLPDDKLWTLNQQNADIREFITQVAKITGETFVIDPRIKSGNTVTVISSKPLTKDEVYDVFLEVLSANGYTVIPKSDGHIINVVPTTSAKTSSPGDTQKPIDGVMTTKVIDLHSVSAVEVIPIIRPLIAQYGHAAASASSNAVIISDLADNVERITKLIRELDDAGNNDYEVIQLKHAWVGDVSKIISDTLVTGKGQLPSGLQVIADERSNRLVVKGNASKRARVRKLADTLDKEGIRKSTTKVMFLSFADAKNIAEILSEASGIIQDSQGKKVASNPSSPVTSGPVSPTASSGQSSPQARTTTKSGAKSKSAATGAFVKADETQNALVMIADPETLQEMEKIVRQLDVPRAQVLLEAVIVEVSGGINDALGIQWGIDGTDTIRGSLTTNPSGTTSSTVTGTKSSITGHILENSGIALGSLALRADNFGVLVSALSSRSNNNILSTPSMLTLDNEEAELIIGKNIPIKTGSYQTSSSGNSNNPFTTTERKDVGLKLKITPHINEGGSLRLILEQEVSSLDVGTTKQLLGSDSNDLLFNTRSLKTAVLVDDGQTVVIGGLIEDIKSKSRKKVPLLGDIPILGNLFRYSLKGDEKKNLMLFIRPTIMRNSETLVKATQDRFTKLKLIGNGNARQSINLPDRPSELFDTETFDLRNSN